MGQHKTNLMIFGGFVTLFVTPKINLEKVLFKGQKCPQSFKTKMLLNH